MTASRPVCNNGGSPSCCPRLFLPRKACVLERIRQAAVRNALAGTACIVAAEASISIPMPRGHAALVATQAATRSQKLVKCGYPYSTSAPLAYPGYLPMVSTHMLISLSSLVRLTLPNAQQLQLIIISLPNIAHVPMGCAAGTGPRPASWKRLGISQDG